MEEKKERSLESLLTRSSNKIKAFFLPKVDNPLTVKDTLKNLAVPAALFVGMTTLDYVLTMHNLDRHILGGEYVVKEGNKFARGYMEAYGPAEGLGLLKGSVGALALMVSFSLERMKHKFQGKYLLYGGAAFYSVAVGLNLNYLVQ